MTRLRALVASLLLAPTFVAVAAAPGHAAACPRGTGLTIVIEGASGGTRCVPDSDRTAWSATAAAGHSVTPVTRSPGAVCRINGFPSAADEKCVVMPPADAYWGLFHADGKGGTWSYSQTGANSLRLPAGSWVAWVFQDSNGRTNPRTTPLGPAPTTSKPSTKPSTKPGTSKPSASKPPAPGSPRPNASGEPGASASPSATASSTAASPTAEADPDTSSETSGSADEDLVTTPGDTADGPGLGLVLGALVVVGLGGAAVAIAVRRR